jgi:hypothetical protein
MSRAPNCCEQYGQGRNFLGTAGAERISASRRPRSELNTSSGMLRRFQVGRQSIYALSLSNVLAILHSLTEAFS